MIFPRLLPLLLVAAVWLPGCEPSGRDLERHWPGATAATARAVVGAPLGRCRAGKRVGIGVVVGSSVVGVLPGVALSRDIHTWCADMSRGSARADV